MTLETRIIKIPVLCPNPQLREYFEGYAREYLADLDELRKVARQVVERILAHLDEASPSIRAIASEMSMSVRTLQVYLKEEGQNFSDLLNDTRQRLAKKYLRENQSIEDIAYMLGFSDTSAFRKAFKKWSDLTPKEYRDQASMGKSRAMSSVGPSS